MANVMPVPRNAIPILTTPFGTTLRANDSTSGAGARCTLWCLGAAMLLAMFIGKACALRKSLVISLSLVSQYRSLPFQAPAAYR
ncbi:hypothetical protein D3C85_1826330 [compost metagenome]